jgi:hypothetical protein
MMKRGHCFVHCLLLEGATIGEVGLLVLSWWCLYCRYKEEITLARIFFFIIFIVVCIRKAIRALHYCIS